MFKEISSIFSFLTIFPSSNSSLASTAKFMFLFPLVGMVIGIIVGVIAYGISFYLDPLIIGLLATSLIVLITGFHHIDGLGDFADALMVKGTKEKKLSVMKDVSLGAAGVVSIVLCLIGIITCLSILSGNKIFFAILMAEIFAKFSMVLLAFLGKSASLGSNTPFVESMKNKGKFFFSCAITIISLVILGGVNGFLIFAVGSVLTLFILWQSSRSFGGITGDVLGATNELTRISSLLVFVSI